MGWTRVPKRPLNSIFLNGISDKFYDLEKSEKSSQEWNEIENIEEFFQSLDSPKD